MLSRTTIRLNDNLLRRAKKKASEEGRTLTSLLEEGLQLLLADNKIKNKVKALKLPISKAKGGLHPGVDINNTTSLLDLMEE